MSKEIQEVPTGAYELPFLAAGWGLRNSLIGGIMPIIEASIPEGKQQEAIKNLVKTFITRRFEEEWVDAFNDVMSMMPSDEAVAVRSAAIYNKAIWDVYKELDIHTPTVNVPIESTEPK